VARVKIDDVVDHLDTEMRGALEDAVKALMPDAYFDPHELFREFCRAVARKCSTWERVPDRFVDNG